MSKEFFRTALFLPAQAAAETEATITSWHVVEGDSFTKGQVLASVESAKTSFEFEAPCDGTVVRVLVNQGGSVAFDSPVLEIETSDRSMKKAKPDPITATAAELPDEAMVPVEKVHIPRKTRAGNLSTWNRHLSSGKGRARRGDPQRISRYH